MTTQSEDKELLEMAAKAAGIDAEFHSDACYESEGMWLKGVRSPDNNKYWNPRINDGDAFRLAVSLKMEVYHANDDGNAVYASYVKQDGEVAYCVEYYDDSSHHGDANAATRLAIVRAAAKTERAM